MKCRAYSRGLMDLIGAYRSVRHTGPYILGRISEHLRTKQSLIYSKSGSTCSEFLPRVQGTSGKVALGGVNQMLDTASVRWQDGSYDSVRTCVMCQSPSCDKPVYNEHYKIKMVSVLDQIEEKNEELELQSMGIETKEEVDDITKLVALEDAGEDDATN